jgi:hypothetical protein
MDPVCKPAAGGLPLSESPARFSSPVNAAICADRRSWVRQIGLNPAGYGTQTLRRTKAALIYRRTKGRCS